MYKEEVAVEEKDYRKKGYFGPTKSLCPLCARKIDAEVYESDGKVMMRKKCDEHGEFQDIYWSDAKLYRRFIELDGELRGINNPITEISKGCPFDCGLCGNHKSMSVLANIDITNRCNQSCPVCFANAAIQNYLFEPTKEEIKTAMAALRNEKPVPCPAVQFSGGEPTVRDDFPDLIRMAKGFGFSQIQVATNGVRIATEEGYIKKLKEAGLNTVYLQFDGVTPKPYIEARGYNALPLKLRAIENCRKHNFRSVVLVPTLVKGVNDAEIGGVFDFCVKNSDVVKSLNVQPVSFTGRIDKEDLKRKRITIPDFISILEKHTERRIKKEDFYPVAVTSKIAKFIEYSKHTVVPYPSCHPACGAATFVFLNKEEVAPITAFVEMNELFELLNKLQQENNILKSISMFALEFPKTIDIKMCMEYPAIKNLLLDVITKGTRKALANLFMNSLFIGCMHFQDLYNFDCKRIERCVIHYALPDGRIIPFCTYNTIHREKIERRLAREI